MMHPTMKTVVLCVLFYLASAHGATIFKPIKGGQDVGLLVIPGAATDPEDYFTLVENIQEASDFALWVIVEVAPTSTIPPRTNFVSVAFDALVADDFPRSAPYISTGHSMGGAMMMEELNVDSSLVDGWATWGADGFITAENYQNFNYPVMTLAGDLDGMTKFTEMAQQFRSLSTLSLANRLRYPVRTLEGLNHMSYSTGPVPLLPSLRDLKAEIEGEPARRMIAADHAFFVDYCAKVKLGQVTGSDTAKLQEWLDYQSEVYAPVINAIEMDQSGSESPWVLQAQRIIGDVNENEIQVENTVMQQNNFLNSQPSINAARATAAVFIPTESNWASGQMLETKMNSKEMFDDVLGRGPGSGQPTCRNVNNEAWDRIYPTISDLARRRFEARSYAISFNDDIVLQQESDWDNSAVQWTSDGELLQLASTSFSTDVSNGQLPGVHYCKLISPFRILEFLYVDCMRDNGF